MIFIARQHRPRLCRARTLYAIARPFVRLSVCLSYIRVDQSKTVVVRIVQLSPYSSPIRLVFAG